MKYYLYFFPFLGFLQAYAVSEPNFIDTSEFLLVSFMGFVKGENGNFVEQTFPNNPASAYFGEREFNYIVAYVPRAYIRFLTRDNPQVGYMTLWIKDKSGQMYQVKRNGKVFSYNGKGAGPLWSYQKNSSLKDLKSFSLEQANASLNKRYWSYFFSDDLQRFQYDYASRAPLLTFNQKGKPTLSSYDFQFDVNRGIWKYREEVRLFIVYISFILLISFSLFFPLGYYILLDSSDPTKKEIEEIEETSEAVDPPPKVHVFLEAHLYKIGALLTTLLALVAGRIFKCILQKKRIEHKAITLPEDYIQSKKGIPSA